MGHADIILDLYGEKQKLGMFDILSYSQFIQIYHLVSSEDMVILLLLFLRHVPELQRKGKWASHGDICD